MSIINPLDGAKPIEAVRGVERQPAAEPFPADTAPALLQPDAPAAPYLATVDTLWQAGKHADIVKVFADRLAEMDQQKISALDVAPLVQQISELYIMQQRLITVTNALSLTDDKPALELALKSQQRLADLQTATFRRTLDIVEGDDPNRVEAWTVYKNTMKMNGFHAPSEEEAYYMKKAEEFIKKGGDFDQIRTLDSKFLSEVESGELLEYVLDAFDHPRVTRSEQPVAPNHTLLARGGDALCSGSMRVFKNDQGEITQVVLGTFSGHFRNGREPVIANMVRHLVAAGVPAERISVHEGEAAGERHLTDLLFNFAGFKGADAQRWVSDLYARSFSWDPYGAPATRKMAELEAAIEKSKKPKKAKDKSKSLEKPSGPHENVGMAVVVMDQVVREALNKGVILSTGPENEGEKISVAIRRVLELSEEAGNPTAYHRAMALLDHLVGLKDTNIDAPSHAILKDLQDLWGEHQFGTGAVDSADVLSPRPADRRARIVATIDPKDSTQAELEAMIKAGLNTARLNVAHGTLEDHERTIGLIRQAAADVGRDVTILVDLPGPKIRLGKFKNPDNEKFNDVYLEAREKVTLTTADILGDNKGPNKTIPVDYPTLADDVKVGHPIFMNDGTVELKATKVSKDPQTGAGIIEAEVLNDGKIWDRKGINLPESNLSTPTVTEFDLKALERLLPHCDLIGVSFVRSADDIFFVKSKMQKLGRQVPVVAKIERREGMANLESIAKAADALMVARGDLGVEIGYEKVPRAQRQINQIGNILGKPTIVATEVLHSMVKEGSRPTRGEVDAVHKAIFYEGADAIMLAKEASGGKYKAEAVRAAGRIIKEAEEDSSTTMMRAALSTPMSLSMGTTSPLAMNINALRPAAP